MTQQDELPPFNIDPAEVKDRVASGARLLDVREPWEADRAAIAGATLIPMRTIQANVESLDRNAELIVFCHHGGRSRGVTDWLRSRGFRARNMNGGIERWSREVDPAVPRY